MRRRQLPEPTKSRHSAAAAWMSAHAETCHGHVPEHPSRSRRHSRHSNSNDVALNAALCSRNIARASKAAEGPRAFGPQKLGLSRSSADANRRIVPRSFLLLMTIAALVIGSLHSPSMLHAEEAEHDNHAALVESDHHDLAPGQAPGVDHGTLAHDHHGPTAMTTPSSRMETPAPAASPRYELPEAPELASWATAPPIEPPAA